MNMSQFVSKDHSLIENEFGEVSFNRFNSIVNTVKNGTLVDIGVYEGASSRIMLNNAIKHNNQVYAIDPIPNFSSDNPNYHFIKDDSVGVGERWKKGRADLVFFDSVHAKEQVLCELYYWWDIIKVGGYAIFHDTSWEGYVHKEGHSCAGKLTGNTAKGYDSYGGIDWETPDKAVETFFNVAINGESRDINKSVFILNYEDDFIKVETNYADLGMTIIRKKGEIDYKSRLRDWDQVFEKRRLLLSFFKKPERFSVLKQLRALKSLFK